MSRLLKLNQQVQTCRLCRLCRTRLNGVPGEGNEKAEVMFIGEGPGFNEDREGRPFVGPAGQFLEELLGVAGFKRPDVYITNVVKCRPPQNRDPLPDEIESCAPYLERQMALIDPLVVVTLGRYSMARFFPEDRITAVAGKARYADGRMVVTMLHPAYALRNVDAKDQMRQAFAQLPQFVERARHDRANRQSAPRQPAVDTAFEAIVEQHLIEIEQRLREAAPPEQAPVEAETPADPFAYAKAVNGARKSHGQAAPAPAADAQAASPVDVTRAGELQEVVVTAPEPKRREGASRRGRKPIADEAHFEAPPAMAATIADEALVVPNRAGTGEQAHEPQVVAGSPEPALSTAAETGAGTLTEQQGAQFATPAGESGDGASEPREQAAAPAPRARKKIKPEPEAVQLSLF